MRYFRETIIDSGLSMSNSTTIQIEPKVTTFLYSALKEAQDSVRSYDTKAQIVGIGFIFSLNLIGKIGDLLINNSQFDLFTVLLAWATVMIPVILFGLVLYPSRKMAPKVMASKLVVKSMYYMNQGEVNSIDEYVAQLSDINLQKELSYELFKISSLRDMKRRRFLTALMASCISYIIIFASHLYSKSGIFM